MMFQGMIEGMLEVGAFRMLAAGMAARMLARGPAQLELHCQAPSFGSSGR